MPTKKFAWKDRDSAALDLIQLAYHAPLHISQDALHVLSAIHSDAIIPDLKEITLDAERDDWERMCALRALAHSADDMYFPELIPLTDEALSKRQQRIMQYKITPDKLEDFHFSSDLLDDIVTFVAKHGSNTSWLWSSFDQADPFAMYSLLVDQLYFAIPQEMSTMLLHRLIALLEKYPDLLNLAAIDRIYEKRSDDKAQAFLDKHFDAIVEKELVAYIAYSLRDELPWIIPFEWSSLKTALLQRRPDLETKFEQDQAKRAIKRNEREKNRADLSYRETHIWHELETLYEQANDGDNEARWELYHRCWATRLSIPARAAATYFFGKLRNCPGVIEKLAMLVNRPSDTWEDYYSPIRFEAGYALFQTATSEAWEALVSAFFVSPSNMLKGFLLEWIECLTDALSGLPDNCRESDTKIEHIWFKALLEE